MANPLVDALTLPTQPPPVDPAELSWLQSLGVFEGRSLPDRNSALLQAGLAMMQAPKGGGGGVAQIAGGIQAGLSDLDKTSAETSAQTQQVFQNTIAQQGAEANTERAAASTTTADSSTVTAETGQVNATTNQQEATTREATQVAAEALGKAQLEEHIVQFKAHFDTRAAQAAKDFAQGRMFDRLPDGSKRTTTEATNTEKKFQAKLGELWVLDQAKNALDKQYSSQEDPVLHNAAWGAIEIRKGLANAENIGLVAADTTDATRQGQNVQAFADPTSAGSQSIAATPEERSIATQMMVWSKIRWQQAIDSNDPQAEAMLNKFPGLKAHAVAILQGS